MAAHQFVSLSDPGVAVRAGGATHVGQVRAHNEDSFTAQAPVYAVADGMGGAAAGEVASRIAVVAVRELSGRPPLQVADVVAAIELANERILSMTRIRAERAGMGTTLAGVTTVRTAGADHWAVFNVGDSRVYRMVEGRLHLLTRDHSEVQALIDSGAITADQADGHPLRHVITRSLGSDPAPAVDIWVFPPSPTDRFVACTDGVNRELSDEQIEQLVRHHQDPQAAAEAIVAAAVEAGGRDNVTAVVVAVESEDTVGERDLVDTAPRRSLHQSREVAP